MAKNLKIQLLIFALVHLIAAALAYADQGGLPVRVYRDQCFRGGSVTEGFASLSIISRLGAETERNDADGFLLKNIAEEPDGQGCLYFFMAQKTLSSLEKKERSQKLDEARRAIRKNGGSFGYLYYAFTTCEQEGFFKERNERDARAALQPLINEGLRHVDIVKLKGENKCLHLFVRDLL